MGVRLYYSTLSDPIDKYEIERNFADVEEWSRNISSGDIASDADIDIDKFAARYSEMHVRLTYAGGAGLPSSGTVMDQAVIPGDIGDEPWKYVGYAWICKDNGDGTGLVKVEYGNYDVYSEFIASPLGDAPIIQLVQSAAGANQTSAGKYSLNYSSGSFLPYAPEAQTVRLVSEDPGSLYLSAATDHVTVVLRFMRRLQE